MPQGIITKYLPATDRRGSRIKASAERGSLTIGYPHEFNTEGAHRHAARMLIAKFCAEDAKPDPKTGRFTPIEKNPWNRAFATGCGNGLHFHVSTDCEQSFARPLDAEGNPQTEEESRKRDRDPVLEALEIADATIQRLAPGGPKAASTQGTRDVIAKGITARKGERL